MCCLQCTDSKYLKSIIVVVVQNMININELDPIRRYLPAAERPRPSSRYSSFQVCTLALVLTWTTWWAITHRLHCRVRQFGPKYNWKTTFCTESCWCHKTRNIDLFTRCSHCGIVAWLHCKCISLQVKSSHFLLLSLGYSILHLGRVLSRKRERFAQDAQGT